MAIWKLQGKALMEETGIKLEGVKLEDLGRAKRITVDTYQDLRKHSVNTISEVHGAKIV